MLVLGTSICGCGPWPIVEYLLRLGVNQFCVPITRVPGYLSDEVINAIAANNGQQITILSLKSAVAK